MILSMDTESSTYVQVYMHKYTHSLTHTHTHMHAYSSFFNMKMSLSCTQVHPLLMFMGYVFLSGQGIYQNLGFIIIFNWPLFNLYMFNSRLYSLNYGHASINFIYVD